MRHARTTILALALATAVGCGGAASQAGSTGADKAAPSRDRNVVLADEIAGANAANLYEALQRLRPEFLRSRGVSSIRDPQPDMPVVFVNGLHHGTLEVLTSIRPLDVQEVRFVSAADATTRYGTGYPGGIIAVTIRGTRRE